MSLAIPRAFTGNGTPFALNHLVVVVVHLELYTRAESHSEAPAILRIGLLNLVPAGRPLAGGLLGAVLAAAGLAVMLAGVRRLAALRRWRPGSELAAGHRGRGIRSGSARSGV